MSDIKSDLRRAFDEGYEKGKADRPSAVDLSSVYSTAYKSGYEKGKADRPQGKWIDKGADLDGTLYYQCSNCHADVIEEQYPNCPYCLARMKGADDE